MIERESTVLFFKDLGKTLAVMENEDAGILIKALFAHADGLEPEGLDCSPVAAIVYPIVKDQMDRLAKYRQEKALAGRVGGTRSGETRSKTKQNEADSKQNEANMKQAEANTKQSEPPYPYPSPYPSPSNKERHFVPPTLEQVQEYVKDAGLKMDAQRFVDYFSSNGWKVGGKAPMKDWKAAARNWAARDKKDEKPKTDYRSMIIAHTYGEAST